MICTNYVLEACDFENVSQVQMATEIKCIIGSNMHMIQNELGRPTRKRGQEEVNETRAARR